MTAFLQYFPANRLLIVYHITPKNASRHSEKRFFAHREIQRELRAFSGYIFVLRR
jgi:hypothetical protein